MDEKHLGTHSPLRVCICVVTLVTAFLMLCPLMSASFAATYTLYPIEAGFVDSETPDTVNSGSIGVFKFNYMVPIGVYREKRSYLKFDLSSIGDSEVVTSLTFYANWNSVSQSVNPYPIDINHVSNDSWQDDTLTWFSQPGFDDFLGSIDFDPDNPAATFWREWDLSGYDYALDLQDDSLSLAMVAPEFTGAGGVSFSLSPSRSPYIMANTVPVVGPFTFCVSTADELQDALTFTANNSSDDVILVVQGTYNGNFVYDSTQSISLTMKGGYTEGCAERVVDPNNTILDAGGSGRVLELSAPTVAADFVVDGLKIQNGNATGVQGGGLFVSTDSGISLTNNIIFNNSSDQGGGGVFISSQSIIMNDNTISTNSSLIGCGVYIPFAGTITMNNNTINDNSSSGRGGGVFIGDGDAVTFIGNTIFNNSSSRGGGVLIYGDTVNIMDNIISNNSSSINGGGVWMAYINAANITNNIIYDNCASENTGRGGGVYISYSTTVTMTNNTISDNRADEGGGIWLELYEDNDTADLNNNIIWNNIAPTGADIYSNNNRDGNPYYSIVNLLNNDFDQSSAGFFIAEEDFIIDSSNLDDVSPSFVDAENGDYHLTSGSPCQDAGTEPPSGLPEYDFEGDPRIYGPAPDIGADEVTYVDSDGDGIPDDVDECPGTAIPESVPTKRLGKNRFALVDGDTVFDTKKPKGKRSRKGKGQRKSFTIEDTAGCSCEQIIEEMGLGRGHEKFGCSLGVMREWVVSVNP